MNATKRRLLNSAAPHFLIMTSLNAAIQAKARKMAELRDQSQAVVVNDQ